MEYIVPNWLIPLVVGVFSIGVVTLVILILILLRYRNRKRSNRKDAS